MWRAPRRRSWRRSGLDRSVRTGPTGRALDGLGLHRVTPAIAFADFLGRSYGASFLEIVSRTARIFEAVGCKPA